MHAHRISRIDQRVLMPETFKKSDKIDKSHHNLHSSKYSNRQIWINVMNVVMTNVDIIMHKTELFDH